MTRIKAIQKMVEAIDRQIAFGELDTHILQGFTFAELNTIRCFVNSFGHPSFEGMTELSSTIDDCGMSEERRKYP